MRRERVIRQVGEARIGRAQGGVGRHQAYLAM
jgi:hypothetical protein